MKHFVNTDYYKRVKRLNVENRFTPFYFEVTGGNIRRRVEEDFGHIINPLPTGLTSQLEVGHLVGSE